MGRRGGGALESTSIGDGARSADGVGLGSGDPTAGAGAGLVVLNFQHPNSFWNQCQGIGKFSIEIIFIKKIISSGTLI